MATREAGVAEAVAPGVVLTLAPALANGLRVSTGAAGLLLSASLVVSQPASAISARARVLKPSLKRGRWVIVLSLLR